MAVDPAVLDAIRAALQSDPENVELRAHLAGLLFDAGLTVEALAEAQAVLGRAPDHRAALEVASSAARGLGDSARSSAYRRLLDALGGQSDGDAGDAEAAGVLRTPDTADALVARWTTTDPLREVEIGELSAPGVRLADVGGMEAVKGRLEMSFLAPMRNPEMSMQFGKSLRGGLLLWGPPGCGKTFMARATAGELGANFYAVGLDDVLDMWVGSSERNLSAIFDIARRNRPCVLFFDELDALGIKRTQLRTGGSAMRGVVNQLLSELDGVSSNNEGVFVLGATNHPWDIDTALLRPGRFDRMLLVLPPDLPAREAILRLHLRGRPTERLDLGKIARSTEGYAGADLALICEQATETAMTASLEAGVVRPIKQQDLTDAAAQVRSSIGPWMETARNFALFSNEGGVYDELAAYLGRRGRR